MPGATPERTRVYAEFLYMRFHGHMPELGDPSRSSAKGLDDEDRKLLAQVEAGFDTVGELYNACKFRAAPSVPQDRPGRDASPGARGQRFHMRALDAGPRACSCFATAQLTRSVSPGSQIKEDKAAAATTVYVILRAVDNLKTILAPVLPHTAQELHEYLGYDGQLFGTQHVVEYEEETRSHRALTYDHGGAVGTWAKSDLPPGQALRKPAPLFKKLDESLIDEEYARLGG